MSAYSAPIHNFQVANYCAHYRLTALSRGKSIEDEGIGVRGFLALCVVALLGSGCAIREQNLKLNEINSHMYENQMQLTPDQKNTILRIVIDSFIDPYSIRDAELSYAVPVARADGTAHFVCLMANAKNRLGGYTGRSPILFWFDPSWKLQDAADSEARYRCGNTAIKYVPFPEIEQARK